MLTTECATAFQALKDMLANEPVLVSPDYEKTQTDASERDIGAVLSQEDDQGQDQAIAAFSCKLFLQEANYSGRTHPCCSAAAFSSVLAGEEI